MQQMLKGVTARMCAALKGHLDTVKELIGAKPKVNTANNGGYIACMYVAARRQTAIVQLLLKADANPKLKNSAGQPTRNLAQKIEDENNRAKILTLLNG